MSKRRCVWVGGRNRSITWAAVKCGTELGNYRDGGSRIRNILRHSVGLLSYLGRLCFVELQRQLRDPGRDVEAILALD